MTVIAGVGRPERDGLITELVGGLGRGRSGVHLEIASDAGTRYAIFRPAREVLFTVVSREEKYSSKSFIDTFVYRSGDALGALADRLVAFLGLSPLGFAWVFLPVAGVWIANALALGRRQQSLARATAESPDGLTCGNLT